MNVRPNSAAFSSVNSSIRAISVSSLEAGGDCRPAAGLCPFAPVTIEVWPPGAGGGETLQGRPHPSDRGARVQLRRTRSCMDAVRTWAGSALRHVSEKSSLKAGRRPCQSAGAHTASVSGQLGCGADGQALVSYAAAPGCAACAAVTARRRLAMTASAAGAAAASARLRIQDRFNRCPSALSSDSLPGPVRASDAALHPTMLGTRNLPCR